jgi:MFS family permease
LIKLLIKYPVFFRFWISAIASQLASRMLSLILIWLVYKWSGSALIVGITMVCASLPSVLISPFSGSLIDRHNKIVIMYASDFIRTAVMFFFAWLYRENLLNVTVLIAGTVVVSVASSFFNPASMSILPKLVNKEDIISANAVNQVSSSASSIIGPLFGSALIATLGGVNAFIGAGVLYLISVFFLFGISDKSDFKTGELKTSLLYDIKSSFSLIKKYDIVYKMITKMAAVNFFFSALVIIAPIITEGNAEYIAYLMSSAGAGMMLSSLMFSSKKFNIKTNTFLALSLIVMGVSFFMLGFARSIYLQNLCMLVIGAGMSAFNIILISVYQTRLPQENLGRIMAFIVAVSLSLQPISYGVIGAFVEWIGIKGVLALSGTVILLSSYGVYSLKNLNKE